ncbi:hypothetical protein GCM10028816_33900 [Spirosoma lituiforme]|jgi:hypothetical protein
MGATGILPGFVSLQTFYPDGVAYAGTVGEDTNPGERDAERNLFQRQVAAFVVLDFFFG